MTEVIAIDNIEHESTTDTQAAAIIDLGDANDSRSTQVAQAKATLENSSESSQMDIQIA